MSIFLKNIWTKLVSEYTADKEIGALYWEEICKNYTHPSRYYHNLEHIESMVNELNYVKNQIEDFDSLLFSVYYHDIVYDATSTQNEEESARIAKERMAELGCSEEKIRRVGAQILATKSHKTGQNHDTDYILDADLAVLGRDWKDYREYAQKIRKEYHVYPDILYNPGRKKVLIHFLNLPRIFKTDHFYNIYEQNARENMQRELEDL